MSATHNLSVSRAQANDHLEQMSWIVHIVVREAILVLPLEDNFVILGFVKLTFDVAGVICNHFFDAQVCKLLLLDSLLLWHRQLMLRNQFDNLALLDGHGAQYELQTNLLVVVLDGKQLGLIDILLIVGTERVRLHHVEAELVELTVIPHSVGAQVVHSHDQVNVRGRR